MDLVTEMEIYAQKYNVPIMQREGIDFMCSFVQEHQIHHILEIGTAIGYSAIRMAMLHPKIQIVTIERDKERYDLAIEFLSRSSVKDQVSILFADALEATVEEQFDMIFIDAAKAQYIKFFERFEHTLKPHGYILTDNLKFHGLLEHSELVTSRNVRGLVKKIQLFIDYLKSRKDYETTFLELGDGVGISIKK